jgi:hypothetical protein
MEENVFDFKVGVVNFYRTGVAVLACWLTGA